ncbi:MAG: hypothetical protein IT438_14785 [Phycisphaerales bacterium]|nr:hypothetical protein [Phycisphaerales bacterium]
MRIVVGLFAVAALGSFCSAQLTTPNSCRAERWHSIRNGAGLGARADENSITDRRIFNSGGSSNQSDLVTNNNWSSGSFFGAEYLAIEQPTPRTADAVHLTSNTSAGLIWAAAPVEERSWSGGYSSVTAEFTLTSPAHYELSALVRVSLRELGEGSAVRDGSAVFFLTTVIGSIDIAREFVTIDDPREVPVSLSGELPAGRYILGVRSYSTLLSPELNTDDLVTASAEATVTFSPVPAPASLAILALVAISRLNSRRRTA